MEALRSRSGTVQKMIEFFSEFFEALFEVMERKRSSDSPIQRPSDSTGEGRERVNPPPESSELEEFLIGYQPLNHLTP